MPMAHVQQTQADPTLFAVCQGRSIAYLKVKLSVLHMSQLVCMLDTVAIIQAPGGSKQSQAYCKANAWQAPQASHLPPCNDPRQPPTFSQAGGTRPG